jgi:hypothetical protein
MTRSTHSTRRTATRAAASRLSRLSRSVWAACARAHMTSNTHTHATTQPACHRRPTSAHKHAAASRRVEAVRCGAAWCGVAWRGAGVARAWQQRNDDDSVCRHARTSAAHAEERGHTTPAASHVPVPRATERMRGVWRACVRTCVSHRALNETMRAQRDAVARLEQHRDTGVSDHFFQSPRSNTYERAAARCVNEGETIKIDETTRDSHHKHRRRRTKQSSLAPTHTAIDHHQTHHVTQPQCKCAMQLADGAPNCSNSDSEERHAVTIARAGSEAVIVGASRQSADARQI